MCPQKKYASSQGRGEDQGAMLSPSAIGLLFLYLKSVSSPKTGLRKNEQNYFHTSSERMFLKVNETYRKVVGVKYNTG